MTDSKALMSAIEECVRQINRLWKEREDFVQMNNVASQLKAWTRLLEQ